MGETRNEDVARGELPLSGTVPLGKGEVEQVATPHRPQHFFAWDRVERVLACQREGVGGGCGGVCWGVELHIGIGTWIGKGRGEKGETRREWLWIPDRERRMARAKVERLF